MPMTPEHKEALSLGRQEARTIKSYLNALSSRKPGRPVTKEALEKRLERLDVKLGDEDDPLRRARLIQDKLDVEESLGKLGDSARLEELEAGFVEHAKSYSERKGITYTAWRQTGVPAGVLRRAGIPETRRRG